MSGVRASLPAPNFTPAPNTKNKMYRIYFTYPESGAPFAVDIDTLTDALKYVESLRGSKMLYVTMVSDYPDMIGKPGATGIDSSYVPQMLN